MGYSAYTSIVINIYNYKQMLQEFKTQENIQDKLNAPLDIRERDEYDSDEDWAEYEKELAKRDWVSFSREANQGRMDELEKYLISHKMEYDKQWDNGASVGAGHSHTRNIKGVMKEIIILNEDEKSLHLLEELLEMKDPLKIKAAIQEKLDKAFPFVVEDICRPVSVDFIKNT